MPIIQFSLLAIVHASSVFVNPWLIAMVPSTSEANRSHLVIMQLKPMCYVHIRKKNKRFVLLVQHGNVTITFLLCRVGNYGFHANMYPMKPQVFSCTFAAF